MCSLLSHGRAARAPTHGRRPIAATCRCCTTRPCTVSGLVCERPERASVRAVPHRCARVWRASAGGPPPLPTLSGALHEPTPRIVDGSAAARHGNLTDTAGLASARSPTQARTMRTTGTPCNRGQGRARARGAPGPPRFSKGSHRSLTSVRRIFFFRFFFFFSRHRRLEGSYAPGLLLGASRSARLGKTKKISLGHTQRVEQRMNERERERRGGKRGRSRRRCRDERHSY